MSNILVLNIIIFLIALIITVVGHIKDGECTMGVIFMVLVLIVGFGLFGCTLPVKEELVYNDPDKICVMDSFVMAIYDDQCYWVKDPLMVLLHKSGEDIKILTVNYYNSYGKLLDINKRSMVISPAEKDKDRGE